MTPASAKSVSVDIHFPGLGFTLSERATINAFLGFPPSRLRFDLLRRFRPIARQTSLSLVEFPLHYKLGLPRLLLTLAGIGATSSLVSVFPVSAFVTSREPTSRIT